MSKHQVKGQVPLASVGGNEHAYEDCNAEVTVTLVKGGPHELVSVEIPEDCAAYFSELGTTLDHWQRQVEIQWDDDQDQILEWLVEDMDEQQYDFLRNKGYFT